MASTSLDPSSDRRSLSIEVTEETRRIAASSTTLQAPKITTNAQRFPRPAGAVRSTNPAPAW